MQITWLGHGSFQLQLDSGETILIDPWFDSSPPFGNPSYPKGFAVSRCDTLLITHGHFDHIAGVMEVAERLQPSAIIANWEIASYFESKGVKNVTGMNRGGTFTAGSVRVTMTSASHSSTIQDGDRVLPGGEPAGYVLHFPDGRRAYFAGDTDVMSDMALIEKLHHPELCFLPIGDLYTMGPDQAALACRMLRPKTVIGMHYGTFPPLTGTPEALRQRIADLPEIEVAELTPGEIYTW
jgi:L-ascorbate metabolism protein UlaG (beta-lactamase superfamily)